MDLQADVGRGSKYSRMLDDYGNEGDIVQVEPQEREHQVATVQKAAYSVSQKRVYI